MSLVRTLAQGPLDVIGDVHGESQALDALLGGLGYRDDGMHPGGRRAVFVGDLCDRGPDSPAVIARVRDWVMADRADCVLGNHELNVLRWDAKPGNGWFWPEGEDHDRRRGEYVGSARLAEGERSRVTSFLDGLPLALERTDIRVVHACWDEAAIAAVRRSPADSVRRLYDDIDDAGAYGASHGDEEDAALLAYQYRAFEALARGSERPPLYPRLAQEQMREQNGNPVKVLTSGRETIASTPFFSSGKWRLLDRVPWWNTYRAGAPVVFGHYWRLPAGMTRPSFKAPTNAFAPHGEADWLGPAALCFCVDFSIGARHRERQDGVSPFRTRLAALRWPERTVVMDDGRTFPTRAGSGAAHIGRAPDTD